MDDYCNSLNDVMNVIHGVVTLFQFGIPILLIVFGLIDLGKAVIASKEDEMKKAQTTLIKRAIYAVAVFLIPTVITLVIHLVQPDSPGIECWYRKVVQNSGNG